MLRCATFHFAGGGIHPVLAKVRSEAKTCDLQVI
jgi:hypothetical protein